MEQAYKGTSLCNIYTGKGPWDYDTYKVYPSKYHTILFQLPATLLEPPKPHISETVFHWDEGYVRMPYSNNNLFPSKDKNGEEVLVSRWEIIKESFKNPIHNLTDFEKAIRSYNLRLPKPTALEHLFNEVLSEDESEYFFNAILPGIIDLALHLPDIVPDSIPLLKAGSCKSVSFSQLQVACLLANAFLCTFPTKKEEVITYHSVNFGSLFAANSRPKRVSSVTEKLKCIIHYFKRILKKTPVGVITFERKHVNRSFVPRWDKLETNLGNTRVHITSDSTIEDGLGCLQVDFANKFVGGGVLGYGCVQEEIRFVINPELIVSRLFTEKLDDNEALLVIGAERFSNYKGYADAFIWDGDCQDQVPFDNYGRRRTSIIAIDATRFNKAADQFGCPHILRELNKSYSGFHSRLKGPLPAIATGNWGCGAFGGNVNLKFLIQLMACSASNRDMIYYTFSDPELCKTLHDMYIFIATNKITICQLWRLLCRFPMSRVSPNDFFAFIQQSYFDSQSQPTLSFYGPGTSKAAPSTSKDSDSIIIDIEESVINDCERMEISPISTSTSIKNKREKHEPSPPKTKRKRIKSDDDLISLIKLFDDDMPDSKVAAGESSNKSFLECIDDFTKIKKTTGEPDLYVEDILDNLQVVEEIKVATKVNCNKKKITDYFHKK